MSTKRAMQNWASTCQYRPWWSKRIVFLTMPPDTRTPALRVLALFIHSGLGKWMRKSRSLDILSMRYQLSGNAGREFRGRVRSEMEL
jgi:hypothetical protein